MAHLCPPRAFLEIARLDDSVELEAALLSDWRECVQIQMRDANLVDLRAR